MSNADLISEIAQILEPWAWETKSWNATCARDDAIAKAEQIAEIVARHRLLGHEAGRRDMREGWVLVPREPTSDMLNQANGVSVAVYASDEPSDWTAVNAGEARAIWEAMLSALPTEPLGGEG